MDLHPLSIDCSNSLPQWEERISINFSFTISLSHIYQFMGIREVCEAGFHWVKRKDRKTSKGGSRLWKLQLLGMWNVSRFCLKCTLVILNWSQWCFKPKHTIHIHITLYILKQFFWWKLRFLNLNKMKTKRLSNHMSQYFIHNRT